MNLVVVEYFKSFDPVIAVLIERMFQERRVPALQKKDPSQYAVSLYRSIVSQQLSVKAADTIFKRFESLLDGDLSPENILSKSFEELRSVGLSGQKAGYIRAIAEVANDGLVDFQKLDMLSNEEVVNALTNIKGVGLWTAEMFLIFTLGREDVFSAGDAGLRRAILNNYPKANIKTKEDFEKFAEQWAPYRSYASLALWYSLDNK